MNAALDPIFVPPMPAVSILQDPMNVNAVLGTEEMEPTVKVRILVFNCFMPSYIVLI